MARSCLFLLSCVVACSKEPAPRVQSDSVPAATIAPVTAAPSAASSPTPPTPKKASACHPPPPGATSEDLTPVLRGTSGEAELSAWMEERGVTHDALVAWITGHHAKGMSKDMADSMFASGGCGKLRVGDPAEDALLCTYTVPLSILQEHVLVVTARAKKPVALLDVGLGLVAMDFPDAHWLDLAFAVAPDGLSAELADRAPDGTKLVAPESACRAMEKRDAECEEKLAANAPLDGCPVSRLEDGGLTLIQSSALPMPASIGFPATLHDCAGGKSALVSIQKDMAAAAPKGDRSDLRAAQTFLEKSCAQRGKWVWQKDHFVKQAP